MVAACLHWLSNQVKTFVCGGNNEDDAGDDDSYSMGGGRPTIMKKTKGKKFREVCSSHRALMFLPSIPL